MARACGERTKAIASVTEMPSAGTASRSTKAAPSWRATMPAALFTSAARRVGVTTPFISPPLYSTCCSARCTSGRSSDRSLRATKGYASNTSP